MPSSPWDLLIPRGAQGGPNLRGLYNSGTTYAPFDAVRSGTSWWICIAASTGNDPAGSPSYWYEWLKDGATAGSVLSEGTVTSAGVVGPASISSSTPSLVDVTGCAVAPNTVLPIDLRIIGVINLATTNSSDTNYRTYLSIVDDLGTFIGDIVIRERMSSSFPLYLPINSPIEVTPASVARTYKLQTSMNDATGGGMTFFGSIFMGPGNGFRLQAVVR